MRNLKAPTDSLPTGGVTDPGKDQPYADLGPEEYRISPYSVIAYLSPVVGVLFFGDDWTSFLVCLCFEVMLFAFLMLIQLVLSPGGTYGLLGVALVIPVIVATGGEAGVLISRASGSGHGLSTLLLSLWAFANLAIVTARRMQQLTLRMIRFWRYMNHNYMFFGKPDTLLIGKESQMTSGVTAAYGFAALYAVFVAVAWTPSHGLSRLMHSLAEGDHADQAAYVLAFTILKFAWDALVMGLVIGTYKNQNQIDVFKYYWEREQGAEVRTIVRRPCEASLTESSGNADRRS